LINAAIRHRGAAFIDVISPCVAFNNHAGSTKSYDYVREHNDSVNFLDVIEGKAPIEVEQPADGSLIEVAQHDGSILRLRRTEPDYDPRDRIGAMNFIARHQAKGEVVTGLLYVDPEARDFHQHLGTVQTPLNKLGTAELCPGVAALDKLNASLR